MTKAVVWVEHGRGGARDAVVGFFPENPEPRPDDVNKLQSWFAKGWRVHSAGGVAATGEVPPTFVSVLTLETGRDR
jgi:hypothetical protein